MNKKQRENQHNNYRALIEEIEIQRYCKGHRIKRPVLTVEEPTPKKPKKAATDAAGETQ